VLLIVTSISFGLASGGAVTGGASYIISPESGATSVVADVEQQRLGAVHRATTQLTGIEAVQWATPVLTTLGTVTRDGTPQRLILIGVIPADDMTIAGLSTASLTPGDPAAAGEPRTGEAVLSATAATELGYSAGDRLQLARGPADANRSFQVTAVEPPTEPGLGQLPVAVVHLRELQVLTGADRADVADRILVRGSGDQLPARLERVYPGATVTSETSLLSGPSADSQLTVAVGIGAFVITTIIGVLFVATTMSFEFATERTDRRVLRAVGISTRSQALVLITRTLVSCVLGGLLGIAGWLGVTTVINIVARQASGGVAIAAVEPVFAPAGLVVAVVIGLVTVPYLLVTGLRGEAVPR
jgi:putative ABC transport system permease protein